MSTITEALQALGSSLSEVEQNLIRHKIKGITSKPDFCPVACYLKKTQKTDQVSVSIFDIMVGDTRCIPPEPVKQFITRFDRDSLDRRLYAKRTSPKWTPPLPVGKHWYQYRIEYDGEYASCLAAEEDNVYITGYRGIWVVRGENTIGEVYKHYDLRIAVKKFLEAKVSK